METRDFIDYVAKGIYNRHGISLFELAKYSDKYKIFDVVQDVFNLCQLREKHLAMLEKTWGDAMIACHDAEANQNTELVEILNKLKKEINRYSTTK